MFKNNLYAFSALIALSCAAYAMENEPKSGRSALRASSASWGDDQESGEGRNALRASTMSLGIGDQESDETEAGPSSPASSTQNSFFPDSDEQITFTWDALKQAGSFINRANEPRASNLGAFLNEMFSSKMKLGVLYKLPILPSQLDGNIWDLIKDREQISKAIEDANAASPASSVPNSLFSNDDAKAIFTWSTLMAAVERGESRAKNLHNFLTEKYLHDEVKWDEKPFYKMPFSQKQLDEDLWTISEPFEAKLAIAVGNIPTTREAIAKLAAAIGHPVNDTMTHKDREIELRGQALKAVESFKALREKLSSTEAEYDSFRALRLEELAAKEEAERRLASQLAERETELETSKAQTAAKEREAEALATQLEASKAQTLAKEEAERQLSSQLATLKAEFEAFKVQSEKAAEGFVASLAEKDANNQRLQSAVEDVKATLAAAGERLASLSTTQASK